MPAVYRVALLDEAILYINFNTLTTPTALSSLASRDSLLLSSPQCFITSSCDKVEFPDAYINLCISSYFYSYI